jgi:hypothetical protein
MASGQCIARDTLSRHKADPILSMGSC